MSSCSRITDDEMRYYQFKARQQFLIKKEDHEWNEFCKKNKCTCCSCQPVNATTLQKTVGIQATSKTASKFNQHASVKRVQERPFSKSLNNIETELEKLKLTVADMQLNYKKEEKAIIQNDITENRLLGNESTLNLLGEQRQNIIRASLLSSLQRLHSSAAHKITKPQSAPSPRNKGFFLPPNLEKQRLISRNAYLSSLINKPKVIGKTTAKSLENKTKTSMKKSKKLPQNIPTKIRKNKVAPIAKSKEEKTLIQLEPPTDRDENIETAIDGIVDDLLGEEILALNRIRFMKLEKISSNPVKERNTVSSKRNIHLHQTSPETRAKIKKIPFFDLSSLKKTSQSPPTVSDDQSKNTKCHTNVNKQAAPTNDKEAQVNINKPISPKPFRTLHTDPLLAQRVSRQRKLYFQYLKRIERAKSHNFDPIALSNMVSESLLDDCISDVCNELDDIPTSLIADLYKQEFTSTL
ncbi:uncharacterized protein [Parasteatoda tepidariorum]|nr:uncharacterized protein LOC107456552 isoform X1 [Parasteatoda tepidariorum]XP_015929931.1 uncharacterized protein LOC107456552 isoform X1 [Parasteatoda tepidariorum]